MPPAGQGAPLPPPRGAAEDRERLLLSLLELRRMGEGHTTSCG